MAHDSQVPEERELPTALQEPKSASLKPTDKRSESLGVLADWWTIYGQIYRDDPTELLATAFRETLQDLPARILHDACLRAQRESPQFRPSPGRIYEIAQGLLEARTPGNRPKYLDEPKMSERDRQEALTEPEYQALRGRILGSRR